MSDVRCLSADPNTEWAPNKCALQVLATVCRGHVTYSLAVTQHSLCDLPVDATRLVKGLSLTRLCMPPNAELVQSQGLPEHPRAFPRD